MYITPHHWVQHSGSDWSKSPCVPIKLFSGANIKNGITLACKKNTHVDLWP